MKHVALITGASSGIGKELARIHAKKGNDLVLVARRKKKLDKLKAELETKSKVQVLLIVKDLSDIRTPAEIFEETQNHRIEVKYLINNAGFGGYGYFYKRSADEFLSMVNVNVVSLMLLTRLYLPGMVERKSGRVLNVSSTASFLPGPLQAVYYASKAFVTSFSQALAEELKNTGVTVTALCPGPVDTEFLEISEMGNANLLRAQKAAHPKKTARIGYRDMEKGKLLSFDNRLLGFSLRWLIHLLPRKTLLQISRKTMERKKS
jgi:uncharacterized protein